MLRTSGFQQDEDRVDSTRRDNNGGRLESFGFAFGGGLNCGRALAGSVGFDLIDLGSRHNRHVGMPQRVDEAGLFRVALGVYKARKAIAGVAANTGAILYVVFKALHAYWQMKRFEAETLQLIEHFQHPWFLRELRIGKGLGRRRLRGVFAALTVHEIEAFGFLVIRFELVIGDRPSGRDSVFVRDLFEIFFTQTQERGAEDLGVSAYQIRLAGPKFSPFFGQPFFIRVVDFLAEYFLRVPVIFGPNEKFAALEN